MFLVCLQSLEILLLLAPPTFVVFVCLDMSVYVSIDLLYVYVCLYVCKSVYVHVYVYEHLCLFYVYG